MFDTYFVSSPIECPVCKEQLQEWQGYDGPCGLFVWKENSIFPIAQRAGESKLSEKEILEIKLPRDFVIHATECHCKYNAEANCKTDNEKWVSTKLVTSANAVQKKHETKSEFKERLKWLSQQET